MKMEKVNKGWVSHEEVFEGLDKYSDGTSIIWNGLVYALTSNIRDDGVRCLGLEGNHNPNCKSKRDIFDKANKWCVACLKYVEPKRNDKCPCNSGKKYKKCCLNKEI